MSVSILDPSLRIKGYFTERDEAFIDAARAVGEHKYMLSFVEGARDIERLLALDPQARIMAKIESRKGLKWVQRGYKSYQDKVDLIAARGDLFLEIEQAGQMLRALDTIISKNEKAVAASRILTSLTRAKQPSCQDVCDIGLLSNLGYRTLLLGDELGFREETLLDAIDTLKSIVGYAKTNIRNRKCK